MIDLQHGINVSNIGRRIGVKMNLSERDCAMLSISGILHDIGKMGVPLSLLNKEGALSADEHRIIEWHTTIGHQMLTSMPDDVHKEAAEVCLFHHERLDGSGYMSLRGQQIPIMARIIAVADVYDALTTDRPYRQAWKKEDATAYMHENAGSMFDSIIVDALLQTLS